MDIQVEGTSSQWVVPEHAELSMTVGTEPAQEPQQAVARTSELVEEITQAIGELNRRVPTPLVEAAVLPITTRHWRPYDHEGRQQPTQHAASARVILVFNDFQALSDFSGTWGGREGVHLDGVEWGLTDETQRQVDAQVLARAVAAARERARIIAQAAHTGDVRLLQVTEQRASPEHPYGAPRFAVAAGDSSGGIELTPREIEVRAAVQGSFVAGSER